MFTLRYPKESEAYKTNPDGTPATKYSPTNLAIAPNSDIYVGDGYGSSYINQYNSKGEFIRTIGGKPHGIIVDTRGKEPILVVADRGNKRLQRFTLDGKHVDFVNGVSMPCHFHPFKNGDMVIPDLDARVTLMDRNNNVVATLGADDSKTWSQLRKEPRDKFIPGRFVCPHMRLLRPRGQHLCGGVGGSRVGDQAPPPGIVGRGSRPARGRPRPAIGSRRTACPSLSGNPRYPHISALP